MLTQLLSAAQAETEKSIWTPILIAIAIVIVAGVLLMVLANQDDFALPLVGVLALLIVLFLLFRGYNAWFIPVPDPTQNPTAGP